MAYKINQLWAKPSRYTAGGNSRKYIVVHNTANTASAKQEAQNLHNNNGQSSFHYAVDSTSIYQCVHDYDTAWAVGAWKGATAYIRNNQSISIEVCNPGTKFTDAAIDRLHWLVRDLMEYYGIPADHVVRHWDCHSGHKSCPAYYAGANNSAWKSLHALITSPYNDPEPAKKDMSGAGIADVPNQAYTGKAVTPKLTSSKGATFTTTYADNVNVGYGKAVASGTGDWIGKVEKSFKILPLSLVPFTDVDPTAWYVPVMDTAVMSGWIGGYGNGKIGPYDTTGRGQACCILANYNHFDMDSPFSDVVASPYYYEAIQACADAGIINGDSKKFRPEDPLTRQEAAAMLYNMAGKPAVRGDMVGIKDASDVAEWAKEPVTWCVNNGIIGSTGEVRPNDRCPRCEFVAMLANYDKLEVNHG